MPSSTLWRALPTALSGATTRLAVRRARIRASSSPVAEAMRKPHTPFHTRLSMEDRGMEARPTMPSAKRLDT